MDKSLQSSYFELQKFELKHFMAFERFFQPQIDANVNCCSSFTVFPLAKNTIVATYTYFKQYFQHKTGVLPLLFSEKLKNTRRHPQGQASGTFVLLYYFNDSNSLPSISLKNKHSTGRKRKNHSKLTVSFALGAGAAPRGGEAAEAAISQPSSSDRRRAFVYVAKGSGSARRGSQASKNTELADQERLRNVFSSLCRRFRDPFSQAVFPSASHPQGAPLPLPARSGYTRGQVRTRQREAAPHGCHKMAAVDAHCDGGSCENPHGCGRDGVDFQCFGE